MTFVTEYKFNRDPSKPGRVLETVRIGEVYISRLEIEPGVVTANFYHKRTNTILFVERGKVFMKFVQVVTHETKEIVMEPGSSIVHLPTMVAIANKNIGRETAIVILFSDQQFRSGDDYFYEVIPFEEL